jgi:cytosine/adenosine deaminase-related metal-dependent hydrolase
MKILAADHVLPISSDPIPHGAVAIDGKHIVAVGARDAIVSQYPDSSVKDFGHAAILPGFVNCHSHLELTSMRGALDDVEHDFGSWLLKVNDLRSKLSPADIEKTALHGAQEGAAAGVTCFGDIGRYGEAGLRALKATGVRGILFQETEFSPDNATAEIDFGALKEKFVAMREQGTELVEVGISPHASYTVSRRLFELITAFALDQDVKLSIHASEAAEEHSLLTRGEGLFASLYDKLGVSWDVPYCRPIEFLSSTGVLAARPLLAHCVTVTDEDIETIVATGSRVAHCPKSNAKFGHGYAPFEKMLDAGIAIGLGSDSVASNNVCDLIEESRFAAMYARNRTGRERFVSARDVLKAATVGGAKALGLDEKIGTIEAGKEADIAVVSLSSLAQTPVTDVEASIVFSSNARDVVMTMVAGEEIFAAD